MVLLDPGASTAPGSVFEVVDLGPYADQSFHKQDCYEMAHVGVALASCTTAKIRQIKWLHHESKEGEEL